ncbi:MAG: FMN-binding protein [Deltaproteobacteria bacterium]|nr:FMN-binding protein [Deltaproteobacteria bacterium]
MADMQTIPGRRVFRALDGSGNLVGWVVAGKGQGFADKVEVLIGLAPEANKLTGIFILDQKETPGLGNYITDEPFTKQFRGLGIGGSHKLLASQSAPKLNLGRVKAVTGATISSQTVCNIINKTVGELQSKLAAARSTKLVAPAAEKKGG